MQNNFKHSNHIQYPSQRGLIVFSISVGLAAVISLVLGSLGLVLINLFIAVILYLSLSFKHPQLGIWMSLILSFISAGLARYISAPWGLTTDILLTLTWIIILLKKEVDWNRLKSPFFILSLLWFCYLFLEMFNPNANSFEAWFYAMRGIGFYQLLSVGIVLLLLESEVDVRRFINIIIIISLIGTLWGFKQQFGIIDAAENHWLYAENHHEEHVLHGVLRVFSFYSDAGQFGASQAMISLLCVVLFLGPGTRKEKSFYLISAVITFLGFAISGTRGALAVPLFGGIIYLLLKKNFSLLISGFSGIIIVFILLKYTFLFQGVEQVRRMRTALDPQNKSLQVRHDNQKIFGRYLANKPFGAGVGTAGYWGHRFNPTSLMANTATDSWYVKIWAETGIVGICLHLGILGYFLGYGRGLINTISDPTLSNQAIALYASIGGVLFSSYANQVFGQMPTGMIMNMAIPFIEILKRVDTKNKTIASC